MARKYLKSAILVYKQVYNVYRTITVYKKLINWYDQKKVPLELQEILLEFADYAASHGRRELAIEQLQHAFSLIDDIHRFFQNEDYKEKIKMKEKIAKKIGLLGIERRYDPSENYYDCMLTKKYIHLIQEKDLFYIQ